MWRDQASNSVQPISVCHLSVSSTASLVILGPSCYGVCICTVAPLQKQAQWGSAFLLVGTAGLVMALFSADSPAKTTSPQLGLLVHSWVSGHLPAFHVPLSDSCV